MTKFNNEIDYDSFICNDPEKCIKDIEENIVKVVRENPGITTYDVYQRELVRLRKYNREAKDSIKKAFTTALGNMLGEEIKATGKPKKREDGHYIQLKLL